MYRVSGRHSFKIVSPRQRGFMHVLWPGATIRSTKTYAVSFWARSDVVNQQVSVVSYNNSCLPRKACMCGGNYSGCTDSYTQFGDTTIANVTLSKDWEHHSWPAVHDLSGQVGIEMSGIAYFDDFNVTMNTAPLPESRLKTDDDPSVNFVAVHSALPPGLGSYTVVVCNYTAPELAAAQEAALWLSQLAKQNVSISTICGSGNKPPFLAVGPGAAMSLCGLPPSQLDGLGLEGLLLSSTDANGGAGSGRRAGRSTP